MAEAVGLAASIAALASVVRAATDIARHGFNAPKEIEQVTRELEILAIQLDFLHDIQERTNFSFDSKSRLKISLCKSLDESVVEFKAVEANLKRLAKSSRGTKGRLCWLLIGRDEALHQTKRLQELRVSLNLTLSLLTTGLTLLKITFQEQYAMNSKDATVSGSSSVVADVCSPKLPLESFTVAQLNTEMQERKKIHALCWPSDCSQSTLFVGNYQLPLLGQTASSLLKTKSTVSRYELALWLSLPYSRALIIRSLWSSRSWLNFSIQNSLRVSRIVRDDSPFLTACSHGQVLDMERQILEGSAAVEDRTQCNQSPLQLAIYSRNYDAVKLLLDRGADVNALFGENGTSALALAIKIRHSDMVRLLLSRDADCHHVTSYGWTPLFYLWWGTSNQFDFVDQAETILHILASRSDFPYTYSGLIDTRKFAAVHMAVMRGTVSQMRFLLDIDPDLAHVKGFLDWTAVHIAVSEGRYEMWRLLLTFYKVPDLLQTKDLRGWTLLHISAAEGNPQITRHLLKLGANWQELSTASVLEVPHDLAGKCCTPLEAATSVSLARRLTYLRDVKDTLGPQCLSSVELEELCEEWTDAVANMS